MLQKAVPNKKLQAVAGDAPFYIVCEPYLGRPLRSPLSDVESVSWLEELAELYTGFFTAWKDTAMKPEAFIVVFPAARLQKGGWVSLFETLVDRLGEMGYCYSQVSDYGRPDALVKRQIVRVNY